MLYCDTLFIARLYYVSQQNKSMSEGIMCSDGLHN